MTNIPNTIVLSLVISAVYAVVMLGMGGCGEDDPLSCDIEIDEEILREIPEMLDRISVLEEIEDDVDHIGWDMWSLRDEMSSHELGIEQAATYTSEPGIHRAVLVDNKGIPHPWQCILPADWLPDALGDLELVVVVGEETKEEVETCYYPIGATSRSITRYGYRREVKVIEAQTGKELDLHYMKGEPPQPCPWSTSSFKDIYGTHVEPDSIISLLSPYVENTTTLEAGEQEVIFPDSNLENAIREGLDKPKWKGQITKGDLSGLSELDWTPSRVIEKISDLTGIQYCINLELLGLGYNDVGDISRLTGLVSLQRLYLSGNDISDISPLTGLTNLQKLALGYTDISDISPLTGLVNLELLDLSGNDVSNISPLTDLVNLQELSLNSNDISDISPLTGLVNLQRLELESNDISDTSPLTGLVNLEVLYLSGNDISDISPLTGLVNLEVLFLIDNDISDVSPLTGLANLQQLYLSGNDISDISPLTGLVNLELLELGDNPLDDEARNVHIPALQERGVYVVF